MTLAAKVLQSLDTDWKTLAEVARAASVALVDVAAALQELSDAGEAETLRGAWRRAAAAVVAEASEGTVVFVDLGNVHDCLLRLVPLAEAGEIQVRAYADLQYNGPGVRPPLRAPGCAGYRADSAQRNAADTQLIWDVSKLCATAPGPLRLLVATKDNGFRHLQGLVTASGHDLAFAQDWVSLSALLRGDEHMS